MNRLEAIKTLLKDCLTPEDIYTQIMELGKKQTPLNKNEMQREHLVQGCQSLLYLISEVKEGKIYFKTHSEALISAGLAQLLVLFYSGRPFEEVLKIPPSFLQELGISTSLTPSRTNGLYSVHLKMKQLALKAYMDLQSH